jgi:hypothetical protein
MHQDSTVAEVPPRDLADQRFAQLYRDHAREILGYALRRCPDPEDAADVVAETPVSGPFVTRGSEAEIQLAQPGLVR